MDASKHIEDTVDDPAQPPISSNPAEPTAAGDKEMGTRQDGTTEPMTGIAVEEDEHEYSWTSSEMELREPDSGRADTEWIKSLTIIGGKLSIDKMLMLKYIRKEGNTAAGFVRMLENEHNLQLTDENRVSLETKIKNCYYSFKKKLKSVSYHEDKVKIDGSITHDIKQKPPGSTEVKAAGRPSVPSDEASARTKRRRIEEASKILAELPAQDALIGQIRRSNFPQKDDLIKIINYCLLTPGKTQKVLKHIEKEKKGNMQPYSEMEALGLIYELGLTEQGYKKLRVGAKERGADIYPSYNRLLSTKDLLHPPIDSLQLTEIRAKFPLQGLLDHTTSRIVEMTTDVMRAILLRDSGTNFTFFYSWGFDGSTGQSNYKQRFTDGSLGPHSDSSLFATTTIPLMVVQGDQYNGHVLWLNTVPQSIRFCRPLELEYTKETKQTILEKKDSVDAEIRELTPFVTTIDNATITINYNLAMTIIDGKVLNAILGQDSSMSCPMCRMTPKAFNDLSNLTNGKFAAQPSTLRHGINPLHAYIRLLELMLHISYKLEIKSWQARGASAKDIVDKRKKEIQEKLFSEMGLRVDFPAPGGSGSSNDGNTARRAFGNYKTFSRILGIDETLMHRLRIILISISHNYPIDSDKFGSYCLETAELYIRLYSWYYMSATLHKILIHGKDIVKNCVIPIGMYSEQAGESRNKVYKNDRLHHSRKSSRELTLRDTFMRSIDSSDPILATNFLSKQQRSAKKEALPPEVLDLLHKPEPTPSMSSSTGVRRELFGEDDDDDMVQEMMPDNTEAFEGLLESEEACVDDVE